LKKCKRCKITSTENLYCENCQSDTKVITEATVEKHKSNYNFVKDKILGDSAEEFALEIIQKFFPKAYRVKGRQPLYDIVVPDDNDESIFKITFEIKNDKRSADTGNIAVEICKKDGTPTGLNISQADYWIYFAAGGMYLAKREDLIDYCKNNNFKKLNGGDNWNTTMLLIPLIHITKQEFFIKLNLEEENANSNN